MAQDKNDYGAPTAVEYGLIGSLMIVAISGVIITLWPVVGPTVTRIWNLF